jgi:hypothetical protein
MRYIGLDVHREFCEVAIAEAGRVRSAGRIGTRRAELELVALESTGGAVRVSGGDGDDRLTNRGPPFTLVVRRSWG